MVGRWFGRSSAAADQAASLYEQVVAQARSPTFYTRHEVPDTPEGRFELIVVHLHLVLRRLKAQEGEAAEVGRRLIERFVSDLDQSLRELGVSDLAVGRRVRNLASGFYGRVAAYDAALEAGEASLAAALVRNLYGGRETAAARLVAGYVMAADAALAAEPLPELLAHGPAYPAPPH